MRGTCSTFGGEHDQGMQSDSGLAFYEPKEADVRPDLFRPARPEDPLEKTWKRLRTESYYVAIRLDMAIPRQVAQKMKVRLTNPVSGATVSAFIVDRGPWEKERAIDMSPGASDALGLDTDQEVEFTIEPEDICSWTPKS